MKTNKIYNLQERLVVFSALIISNTNDFKKSFATENLFKRAKRVTS